MSDLRTAAQQALEALEDLADCGTEAWSEQRPCVQIGREAITALRAALAQEQDEPVEEPVYKVKVTSRWHDTEPLAPAFSLPDGEHLLYTAPPQRKQAEPLNLSDPAVQKRLAAQWGYVHEAQQAEPAPAAVVATQSDVWRGYNGQWAPPGEPIKVVQMLRDLPTGTLLYTAPPQRKQAEPETCIWHQDGDSDSGVYATSCGHYFSITDGTPEDNKMQWCCYCGKKLTQELITEDDDERSENRSPAGAGGVAVALPPRTQQYPRRVPSED